MAAVLEMVNTLTVVAFAQLLADKSEHHGAHPLLADDGVLCGLEGLGVVEVDAIEGGRDGRLVPLEALGLWRRHLERCFSDRKLRQLGGIDSSITDRIRPEPESFEESRR